MCHLFPILPLLVFLSAQILLKPAAVAAAAAAVETLKCDVCISSQLLKSLPLSLSLCAFPFFLPLFLSPYIAELRKASRLHEKRGKHCSQAAEI